MVRFQFERNTQRVRQGAGGRSQEQEIPRVMVSLSRQELASAFRSILTDLLEEEGTLGSAGNYERVQAIEPIQTDQRGRPYPFHERTEDESSGQESSVQGVQGDIERADLYRIATDYYYEESKVWDEIKGWEGERYPHRFQFDKRAIVQLSNDYVVVEYGAQMLSRIGADGNRLLLYRFREGTWPRSVVADSASNFIVTELLADVLSRITPNGQGTVIYRFSKGTIPDGVAIGPKGNYIVTESGVNLLSRIIPNGARTVVYRFPDGLGRRALLLIPEETT